MVIYYSVLHRLSRALFLSRNGVRELGIFAVHLAEQGLPHGDCTLGDMAVTQDWQLVEDLFVCGAFQQLARHAGVVLQKDLICVQDGLHGGQTIVILAISTP